MSSRNAASEAARRCLSGLAAASWIALAVYCLLSSLAGPAGILSYRRLEERNAAMRENLGKLGEANARLRVELESLRSDADRAAREARSLGYLRPGEGAIVLAGRDLRIPDLDEGGILAFEQPKTWPDSALKEIALGAFLAAFAAFLAPRKGR